MVTSRPALSAYAVFQVRKRIRVDVPNKSALLWISCLSQFVGNICAADLIINYYLSRIFRSTSVPIILHCQASSKKCALKSGIETTLLYRNFLETHHSLDRTLKSYPSTSIGLFWDELPFFRDLEPPTHFHGIVIFFQSPFFVTHYSYTSQ